MKNALFLGVDVGSVSTNLVLMDGDERLLESLYLKTGGKPIDAMRSGLITLRSKANGLGVVRSVGTTGSGRQLADVVIGADIVKNEITAHAVAAQKSVNDVRTVIEIGGQDSKLILLRDGIVNDFSMNTVCAAGTGSFLDRQAARLDIPIEQFGSYALRAASPVRIAGRCAVFAESDMIHKQQTGHGVEDIVAGLCEALVRNYLSNLAKGKRIEPPIVFQGGVASNTGMVAAFEKELKQKLIIPPHHNVMGAFGAALLAKAAYERTRQPSRFRGFELLDHDYCARSIECSGCANLCEVIEILSDNEPIACWGDRCGKWTNRTANPLPMNA